MKKLLGLAFLLGLVVGIVSEACAWNFRVGEDWTQSDKNFSTSGTLASGSQAVTGNSVISGTLTVGGVAVSSHGILGPSIYNNTDYSSISAAITAIGAVNASILRICDSEVLADGTSVTVTDNITLDLSCGGNIDGISGGGTETLTLEGPINLLLNNQPFLSNLVVINNCTSSQTYSIDDPLDLRDHDFGATKWIGQIVDLDARVWHYDKTSSAADDGVDVLKPTGSSTSGRWLRIATTGELIGDVVGDVYATDSTSLVLNSGTDGTDAWLKGDVRTDSGSVVLSNGDVRADTWFSGDIRASNGSTTILDVDASTATFTGNVTGNVTGTSSQATAIDTLVVTATNPAPVGLTTSYVTTAGLLVTGGVVTGDILIIQGDSYCGHVTGPATITAKMFKTGGT